MLCGRCEARLPMVASRRDHKPSLWYAGEYEGLLRDLVLAHKERGVRALTPKLGSLLALALAEAAVQTKQPTLVLVPIPAHRASLGSRGRNTLDEIARAGARALRANERPCEVRRILRWSHEHDRHAGSSARARWELNEAFQIRQLRQIHPAVVVVDDVVTTGATVTAAVASLEASGIRVAAVASIASRSLRTR